jgi:hypothetical protein
MLTGAFRTIPDQETYMKKLLLMTTALLALSGAAKADIALVNHLSGSGHNVISDSISGNLNVGHLNGQNTTIVDFTNLDAADVFTGASSGNDIKIGNTNHLGIQVFDSGNHLLGTTTQIFSVNGTGDLTVFVQAQKFGVDEALKSFGTFTLDIHKPTDFTFTASNNEVMTGLFLLDVGGKITDFEHYRIDVAPLGVAAVPEASTWLMMILGFCGVGGLAMRKKGQLRLA